MPDRAGPPVDSLPRLGVDFGRVINDAASHPCGDDRVFLDGTEEQMLATPAMRGAFAALTRLTEVFGGRIWVISKCDSSIQARTERWLAHHRFCEITGIDASHVLFCREWADKATHCAELGITHFIDDRHEVLAYLIGLVPHLYLFGPLERPPEFQVVVVPTWEQAEREVLATV